MLRLASTLVIVALSATAYAEDFSYNLVSLSYTQTDFDDIDIDGSGVSLALSAEVGDSFFVFGEFGDGDLDSNLGGSADLTQWGAGIGHHYGLSDKVDLVSRLSYQYIDLSVPGFGSIDEDGIGIDVGLRFAASEALELNAGIGYVDFGGDDDTAFGVGALYNVNDAFSVGLSGEFGDDASSFSLGGRFYFGQ